jgi:hypothetical protein
MEREGLAAPGEGNKPNVPTSDSLLRLELLVAVCQQLPEAEADEMMWLAIDDPLMFTTAMLSAHLAQKVR